MEGTRTKETVRELVPWRSGTLQVILASSLMGVMGITLISPVLPALRPVFGVSDAQVGLIITAYTLPGIFITPFIGLLADRIGRKRVLVPLLLIFGVTGATIAFTRDFQVVLALRFLQGIGASALVSLAITLIGDLYYGAQQEAIIGINGSTIAIGAAAYPVIGGALAALHWTVPFLFFGVGVLVGIFALLVMDEPTSADAVGVRTYVARMATVARMPSALAVFFALFAVIFIFYGAVITALPLLLSDEFGVSAGLIGVILAGEAVSSAIVASQYGRIARYRTPAELVALGFAASGTSLLLVWLAPTIYAISAALFVFGVGFGIIFPSTDTAIIALVSEDLRAGMMGLRTSMLRLGQTLGPIGFTFSAETFFPTTVQGYRVLILLAGAVVITGGIGAYLTLRR